MGMFSDQEAKFSLQLFPCLWSRIERFARECRFWVTKSLRMWCSAPRQRWKLRGGRSQTGRGMLCFFAARARQSGGLNIAGKVAGADVAETGGTIIGPASCSNNNSSNSRSRSRSSNNNSSGNNSSSDSPSSSTSHRSSSRKTSCSRTAATAAVWRSWWWWWWWLGWRTAAMDRQGRGYGGRGGGVRYGGCRGRAVWGSGRGLPSYFLPSGGNIYSRHLSNLFRLVGNQPPVHGADPRKRCQNCNELGDVHQYCPWHVDQGYPLPPRTTLPRPGDTVPGGRFPCHFTLDRRQPWQHPYDQANIAVFDAADAVYGHALLAHGLDPTTDEATETDTTTTTTARCKPIHTTSSRMTRRRIRTTLSGRSHWTTSPRRRPHGL